MTWFISSLALLVLSAQLTTADLPSPPPGKIFFGAWLDTIDSTAGAGDGDRPVKFNERMGFTSSVFQYAQNLPLPAGGFPFPDDQIYATNTTAVALLTVYPRPRPWNISDSDIQALAQQCSRLTRQAKRRVILRFAPEMNGNWIEYGQQPTQYRALWIRVHKAIKDAAPDVAFLWSPSSGIGYPYGNPDPSDADSDLMDTNTDGTITAADNPYSPYYPGDEYVDWVGSSIYTYGTRFPWSDNSIATPGKFLANLNDRNFYQTYAVAKNKSFSISETAAAFHVNTPLGPGVGELEVKRSWWRQYITNETFLSEYKQIRLVCLFEFQKFEERHANGVSSFRDFRKSNKTEIRQAFVEDLMKVRPFYLLGNLTVANITVQKKASQTSQGATLSWSWSLLAAGMIGWLLL